MLDPRGKEKGGGQARAAGTIRQHARPRLRFQPPRHGTRGAAGPTSQRRHHPYSEIPGLADGLAHAPLVVDHFTSLGWPTRLSTRSADELSRQRSAIEDAGMIALLHPPRWPLMLASRSRTAKTWSTSLRFPNAPLENLSDDHPRPPGPGGRPRA